MSFADKKRFDTVPETATIFATETAPQSPVWRSGSTGSRATATSWSAATTGPPFKRDDERWMELCARLDAIRGTD